MARSRLDILDEIRSIRGTKKAFINFLRSKGLKIPSNASWDDIVDIVLRSRSIKTRDLEYFLVRFVRKRRIEEVIEEEKIVERRKVKRVKYEESTISYVKGMILEREFEYLVGLLGFDYKRWVDSAGGEIGDYEVVDPSTGAKTLVSCKNTARLTVKHINDLYANAIAFNYTHAIIVVGKNTKITEGASERAKYLGIQILNIEDLQRNLLSRKNIQEKINYLRMVLFGAELRKTKEMKYTKYKETRVSKHIESKRLYLRGLIAEPLKTSLDEIRSILVRKHMGLFRRNIAIHLLKYILYLVPYYEVEYEGRVKIGRRYENFRGKMIINAAEGGFEGLSIEELVESPRQFKEPFKVKFKSIYKVVEKLSDKVLERKITDYIVALETRYLICEEGLFTSKEEIITPRIILEEDLADIDDAIQFIEDEYHDEIEKEYIPRKSDIRIINKELFYIPYWCLEYEVLPRRDKKEAWAIATISEPEVYVEPCPWK